MYAGSLTASNRADFIKDISVISTEDNSGIDVTSSTIVVSVREPEGDNKGYQRLSGSTTDGAITFPDPTDTSKFRITFSRNAMASIPAGDYDMGITIEINGVTTQVASGKLYVIDGVVP